MTFTDRLHSLLAALFRWGDTHTLVAGIATVLLLLSVPKLPKQLPPPREGAPTWQVVPYRAVMVLWPGVRWLRLRITVLTSDRWGGSLKWPWQVVEAVEDLEAGKVPSGGTSDPPPTPRNDA